MRNWLKSWSGIALHDKIVRRWNIFKLRMIVRLMGWLNINVAHEHALWDDAQNTAEKAAKKDVTQLLEFAGCFTLLAERCRERADDLVSEAKQHAESVAEAYRKATQDKETEEGK